MWTNAYRVPPEELGGQPSSKFVAHAFTGARLVKGFNHLVAAVLDQNPAVHGGRRVVFLASDDDGAADEIAALAGNLGFASRRDTESLLRAIDSTTSRHRMLIDVSP
jgi:predicted dinucleotide-binding enzyme